MEVRVKGRGEEGREEENREKGRREAEGRCACQMPVTGHDCRADLFLQERGVWGEQQSQSICRPSVL